MKKFLLLLCLLALTAQTFGQAQTQTPARTVYVFAPPKTGGTSADLRITVQVASGSTAMTWCDGTAGTCGGATAVSGYSFNPKFSTAWVSLAAVVNATSKTIVSCASATACTLNTAYPDGTCATSCTLRLTGMLLNAVTGRLLNDSYIAGVANFVDWGDVDMSGSINVTNGSAAVTFGTVFQHCSATSSCSPTTFACSSAWNGKSFQIFDSSGTPTDRTFTLTNCTTLGSTFPGTTGTYLFHWLYDFTIPDAMVAQFALNGKKVALIIRPSPSSSVNNLSPAYVSGEDYANSQVQRNADVGYTVTGTQNSNLITFSGGNQIAWAGQISINGNNYTIDHCIPGGTWGYSTNDCLLTTNFAQATASGLGFTWTPHAVDVCFSSSYAGGLAGSVINGITYASVGSSTCRNTQLGSAPLRTASNPTGINVYYSFAYQNAWQAFCKAVLTHYQNDARIAYARCGGPAGGEWFPFAQTQMTTTITPSATVSDPAWSKYLYLANNDAQNAAIQSLSLPAAFVAESSANNCIGAGSASDWACADLVFSDAMFRGLKGIGSQGLAFSDMFNYAGFPCSGDWCKNFDYIQSCQPSGRPECPSTIITGFLAELQEAGNSDPYCCNGNNVFYGVGTANPPVSAVRTNGKTVVTFTSDPTSGLKSDGTGSVTLANWDASFNGSYRLLSANAGAKTITFHQPNAADATSTLIGWVGSSTFGSWTSLMPFLVGRGANDIELYLDDALTLDPDPNDTYHTFIGNSLYYAGQSGQQTLGATWLKNFKDFVSNAIQ